MCYIVLTEEKLFVLEDEYDGTYTAHYEIPCGSIEDVGNYVDDGSPKDKSKGSDSSVGSAYGGIAVALAGIIAVPYALRLKKNNRVNYLQIKYKAEEGGNSQMLFFSDISGSISRFAKAFKKLSPR
jgi:hypothetical protein